MPQTVVLLVGHGKNGPAYEEVHVEPRGVDRYVLLQSPGLALGIAAGDIFSVASDKTFRVLERAGNVCIQIFGPPRVQDIEHDVTRMLSDIEGRLDGMSDEELVYTVPLTSGFNSIETVLERVVRLHPSLEWYYGNVYDPDDGVTPLNWWLH